MYKMEVEKILYHTQYALPVGGVLLLAILVFAFGFKSVAEPSFSAVVEGKKKKPVKQKTKKTLISNGSASPVGPVEIKKPNETAIAQPKPSPAKSAAKKDSPKKPPKVDQRNQVGEIIKKGERKIKEKPQKEPKPADFDEGEWQAVNKKEKKKRVDGNLSSATQALTPSHQSSKKSEKKEIKEGVKEKPTAVPLSQNMGKPETDELESTTKQQVASNEVKTDKSVIGVKANDSSHVENLKATLTISKGEKNNNTSKLANDEFNSMKEGVRSILPADDNIEDQWQENKNGKKKKKARRE